MTNAKSQNEQLPNASYKQMFQQTSVGAREQRLGRKVKALGRLDEAESNW